MTLEFDITRKDYADFNRRHFYRRRRARLFATGILVMILVGYVMDPRRLGFTAALLAAAAAGAFYFLIIDRQLRNTGRIPRDDGSILGRKTIHLGDEAIFCRDSVSETTLKWNSISELDETRKAFYLYTDTNMAIVIPKRYFGDRNQETEFRSLIMLRMSSSR